MAAQSAKCVGRYAVEECTCEVYIPLLPCLTAGSCYMAACADEDLHSASPSLYACELVPRVSKKLPRYGQNHVLELALTCIKEARAAYKCVTRPRASLVHLSAAYQPMRYVKLTSQDSVAL